MGIPKKRDIFFLKEKSADWKQTHTHAHAQTYHINYHWNILKQKVKLFMITRDAKYTS